MCPQEGLGGDRASQVSLIHCGAGGEALGGSIRPGPLLATLPTRELTEKWIRVPLGAGRSMASQPRPDDRLAVVEGFGNPSQVAVEVELPHITSERTGNDVRIPTSCRPYEVQSSSVAARMPALERPSATDTTTCPVAALVSIQSTKPRRRRSAKA